ncbi:DUF3488 and transglutaminase-like domain-containing protein [uncultured Marinobacter sp.]|uniref:transglutaminase TgpA family protein n=1 Tax=uncultured Marinobacter sp. TaxID=187379 RepID=UPI000C698DE0|nr:transglutaminase [Oceanospirillales bacterium]
MSRRDDRQRGRQPSRLPSQGLLWLVAAFIVLLLPQWDRLPAWLIAVCLVLAGWRWLAQRGRVRLPGRLPRMGIMALLITVYIASVSGRFTVDTAASFFVLAVGLKWLETRNHRDFYVLFFILAYLASVNFLFRQEILWTLVNFLALGLLLVALQVVNAPDLPDGLASGWRRLGGLFLKGLPFVILVFVFFPRMGPLWTVPLVSGHARSGLSDTLRPGDISHLAQSSERVFRVTFGGAVPAYRDRYWRGLVLDYLDGETWRQTGGAPVEPLARVATDGGVGPLAATEYEVLLEPTDRRWAFALAGSEAASGNLFEVEEDLFRFPRPADSPVRYRLRLTGLQKVPGTPLDATQRHRYLQLPEQGNPRARALAASLAGRLADTDVVAELLTRFQQQPYFYTLRPPAMPENGVDALLFDQRRGFCAHYAGATTFVLRAAGIPARIVVGYQGGEAGVDDEYLIVRQYDAHAWVEAWLDGRGWVRVDPTAAIAPARIESGLRDAVAEEGSFLESNPFSPQRYRDIALLQWASLQLDRINYQWQRWVVGYQGQSQMDLMSRLPGGLGLRELGYLTAGGVGVGLLALGLVSYVRSPREARRDGHRRLLEAWQALCRRAGVEVRPGDTPDDLAKRLARTRPEAGDTARRFARMINSHYYNPSAPASSSDLRRMRRTLSIIRRQLRGHRTGTGNAP